MSFTGENLNDYFLEYYTKINLKAVRTSTLVEYCENYLNDSKDIFENVDGIISRLEEIHGKIKNLKTSKNLNDCVPDTKAENFITANRNLIFKNENLIFENENLFFENDISKHTSNPDESKKEVEISDQGGDFFFLDNLIDEITSQSPILEH